ncbi:HD domain-containing phosphohydrolase [Niveispirillum sp.]|uniref:HD domain-containing phosphohydrolase n=1 Tax=Niveispirillum sp. TaxID=1917217 RepID=UPI0025EB14CF|nr:HD domain-containing phosphohydrolase [Niveispirillum sp.]
MTNSAMTMEEQQRHAHILVVDDLPANVELLLGMLELAGFENVSSTTDPFEGLAMAERQLPDLVLLDYRMPGLDGPGFIGRLRSLLDADMPPVLVVTAQNDDASRRRALEAGARDYVTKPYAFWELEARSRNLLELHLLNKAQRQQTELLERLVKQRTAELERTRAEIITRLCSAGEFRDEDTGQHVTRIGRMAGLLASLAKLPPPLSAKIASAAPLHDIGKIGIPDRVLLKPGKLDEDEWAIMKGHARIGQQLLAGSGLPLLDLASEIAGTHHERWDGSGYPNGLAGTDIPVSGRIVAICDVFDALLSPRPYKRAWAVDDVVTYMREIAGAHLDPDLTRLFIDNLDRMLAIRAELAD